MPEIFLLPVLGTQLYCYVSLENGCDHIRNPFLEQPYGHIRVSRISSRTFWKCLGGSTAGKTPLVFLLLARLKLEQDFLVSHRVQEPVACSDGS